MRKLILFSAALLSLVNVPAAAAQATAVASGADQIDLASLEEGPYREDALNVANSTLPRDPFVRMVRDAMINGFKLSLQDGMSALEAKAPGIITDFEKALTDAAGPYLLKIHDQTRRRYARLYSRTFNASEIAELNTFYRCPIGQKLLARKYGHLASAEFAKTIDLSEPTSPSDIAKVNRDVARGLVPEMSAKDQQALLDLMARPVFTKLSALKPVVDRLEAEQANKADPELEEALTKAVTTVLARHKLGG